MRNETIFSTVPNTQAFVSPGLGRCKAPGRASSVHYHTEIEMLMVLEGRMRCVAAGETVDFGKGDVLFIASNVPHETFMLQAGTGSMLIQFDPGVLNPNANQDCRYLFRLVNSSCDNMVIFHEDPELIQCMKNIQKEYIQKQAGYDLYIRSELYHLLGFLYRHKILVDPERFFDRSLIERVLPTLHYIDEHYDEPVTLDQLSSIQRLDPSYFCRLFKKATHRTLMDYLNFVRVCKSEKLLAESELTIAEICSQVGFSSTAYFNRVFRKYKSCTPSLYRKMKHSFGI